MYLFSGGMTTVGHPKTTLEKVDYELKKGWGSICLKLNLNSVRELRFCCYLTLSLDGCMAEDHGGL